MQQLIKRITDFLKSKYGEDKQAVIAVSGGVDSAVALTLLTRAIGRERVIPVMLPYGQQNMDDAKTAILFNNLTERAVNIDIEPVVRLITDTTSISEPLRMGNVMARVRMIFLFDLAKKNNALVCGTENKSEKYLGYYTRFGDAASDVEPISSLYKTQVWEMAKNLNLPEVFVIKPPSAGLWEGQTDEEELGFSYSEADQVLRLMIDEKLSEKELKERLDAGLVERVMKVVQANKFKLEVPYEIGN